MDNSVIDYFTWMFWTISTASSTLWYRLSQNPGLLSFLFSFLADEYAHVVAITQVTSIFLIARMNPRLLHTTMGKFFCLVNFFLVGLHANSVYNAMVSLGTYKRSLSQKGIATPGIQTGFWPMLLSLLTFGRKWLPQNVVSTEYNYADMEEVDKPLVELNKGTSRTIKRLISTSGRGRRAKWMTLDIIKSATGMKSSDLLPVLFYIHGGGWTVGDKDFACRPMLEYIAASQNIIVATINYRLAPERTFPSQLVDAKRALAWVKRNIKEHGGNPAKIVVAGESAGGHLSAMIGLTMNNLDYQPEEDPECDTSVKGVVDLYGVYDLARGSVKLLSQRILFQERITRARDPFAAGSPTTIVENLIASGATTEDNDPPPMLIIHGTNDSLAPSKGAKIFYEKLQELRKVHKSSKKDVLAILPGAHHAFGYLKTPRAISTALAISDFIKACVNDSRL